MYALKGSPKGSVKRGRSLISLFLFVLLGACLRIYQLGRYSLWYDEAKIIAGSKLWSLTNLWESAKIDARPFDVGHYANALNSIFYSLWSKMGEGEFILRLPSAIFSILSIIGIYCLGKAIFGQRAGLISSFFLAISPFHIYYAQELKLYSLTVLLGIISVYFLIRGLEEGKSVYWSGYVIFNTLNIYLHYLAILLFFAEITFPLIYPNKFKHVFVKWSIGNLIVFLLVTPCLLIMMTQIHFFIEGPTLPFWTSKMSPVSLRNLFFTLKNFTSGYNSTKAVFIPNLILFTSLFVLGILNSRGNKWLPLALLCLGLPPFTLFLTSEFMTLYVDRYVIASSIFLYLVVAQGILSLKNRGALTVIMLSILSLSLFSLINYYSNNLPYSFRYHVGVQKKKDHRSATAYVLRNFQAGDIVLHTCENTIPSFEYYSDRDVTDRLKGISKRVVISYSKDGVSYYELKYPSGLLEPREIDINNYSRAWLLFSRWEFTSKDQRQSDVIRWLDGRYRRLSSKKFEGVYVYLYAL
jgi:4-amino-4-deoxy-L-arabinose transferase-like glycosyltransferase